MHVVVSVTPLPEYQLKIRFDDGIEGIVSLHERLFGPVFEPLQDVALFNQAMIDEFGVVCWPNGADLAPEALYERLRQAAPTSVTL
ncbi:MAG: DUF2442 domain-containing protein [Planctomycetales bacterium]